MSVFFWLNCVRFFVICPRDREFRLSGRVFPLALCFALIRAFCIFEAAAAIALYASTPPFEALRLILSHSATHDDSRPDQRRELMVNDVRRAYFYAKQQRNVFIDLPDEDQDAYEGEVSQLMLCLYGTCTHMYAHVDLYILFASVF